MARIERAILLTAAVVAIATCSFAATIIYARHHPPLPPPKLMPVESVKAIAKSLPPVGIRPTPHVLIEFLDYGCTPSVNLSHKLLKLENLNSGRLQVYLKQLPNGETRSSRLCAEFAESARIQNMFEPAHDLLTSRSGSLSLPEVRDMALQLGLDVQRVQRDLKAAAKRAVDADISLANALGIRGTPTLFLLTPDSKLYRLASVSQVGAFLKFNAPK